MLRGQASEVRGAACRLPSWWRPQAHQAGGPGTAARRRGRAHQLLVGGLAQRVGRSLGGGSEVSQSLLGPAGQAELPRPAQQQQQQQEEEREVKMGVGWLVGYVGWSCPRSSSPSV